MFRQQFWRRPSRARCSRSRKALPVFTLISCSHCTHTYLCSHSFPVLTVLTPICASQFSKHGLISFQLLNNLLLLSVLLLLLLRQMPVVCTPRIAFNSIFLSSFPEFRHHGISTTPSLFLKCFPHPRRECIFVTLLNSLSDFSLC